MFVSYSRAENGSLLEDREEAVPSPYGERAQAYWKAGWKCPMPLTQGGKGLGVPKGVTGASGMDPTQATITAWYHKAHSTPKNIALRLPENVIGIDVDVHKEEDPPKLGHLTLKNAEEALGSPLPPTWSSTARGKDSPSRIHLYILPDGVDVSCLERGLRKFAPEGASSGVDVIRRAYRYMLVWPSIHPTVGSEYRWYTPSGESAVDVVPSPSDLPVLPEEWAKFASGCVSEKPVRTTRRVVFDDADPFASKGPLDLLDDVLPLEEFLEQMDFLHTRDYTEDGHVVQEWMAPGATTERSVTIGFGGAYTVNVFSSTAADALNVDVDRGYNLASLMVARYGFEDKSQLVRELSAGVREYEVERELPDWMAESLSDDKLDSLLRAMGPATGVATERLATPVAPRVGVSQRPVGRLPFEFWSSHHKLERLWKLCEFHKAPVDGVLLAVLTRLSGGVSPKLVMNHTGRKPGSLNLFGTILAESGRGKSTSADVAEHIFPQPEYLGDSPFTIGAVTSGEGIMQTYMGKETYADPTNPKKTLSRNTQVDYNKWFVLDEGRKLLKRFVAESDISEEVLNQAFWASLLETANAETERRRRLSKGLYSLGLCMALQKEFFGELYTTKDSGFMQRMLFAPGWRNEYPVRPDGVEYLDTLDIPLSVSVDAFSDQVRGIPRFGDMEAGRSYEALSGEITASAELAAEIDRLETADMTLLDDEDVDEEDALSTHRLGTKRKVSALLALLLNDRPEVPIVTEFEWGLAEQIIQMSDKTREYAFEVAEKALKEKDSEKAKRRAHSRLMESDELAVSSLNRTNTYEAFLATLVAKIASDPSGWIRASSVREAFPYNSPLRNDKSARDALIRRAVDENLVVRVNLRGVPTENGKRLVLNTTELASATV